MSTCYKTQKKLCSNENCDICFERSFASSDKAKFFVNNLNNDVHPRDLFKGTHKNIGLIVELTVLK